MIFPFKFQSSELIFKRERDRLGDTDVSTTSGKKKILKNLLAAQVCDATMLNSSNSAGNKKKRN